VHGNLALGWGLPTFGPCASNHSQVILVDRYDKERVFTFKVKVKDAPNPSSEHTDTDTDTDTDKICPIRCGEGTIEKDGVCYGVRNTKGGDTTTTCAHYNWPTKYMPKNQCQCNDLCKKYNNCCSDHAHEKSCGKRDHPDHYMPNAPCQCNSLCVRYGNCCSDSYYNN